MKTFCLNPLRSLQRSQQGRLRPAEYDYGSSSFGRITSQANLPRNIQLSAKLHF